MKKDVRVNYLENNGEYYANVKDIINMLKLLDTKETKDLAKSIEDSVDMLILNSLKE